MTAAQQLTRVYLSGPMFSAGDQWEQCALATTLEADGSGIKCHVPQRDGIEVARVMDLLNNHTLHPKKQMLEPFVLDRCIVWVTRTVVALDVFQVVEGCQIAVLNIDGRVPDEGSLVEATLAWYAGHPVVPFKTTSISELDGNDNPMIGVISNWAHVSKTPAEVLTAVKAAVKSAGAGGQPVTTPPPDVQQLVDLGRVVSEIRGRRLFNKTQLTAAAKTLASIPPQLMELLEPVPLLQPMCREVVLAVIEYAKLDPKQTAKGQTMFRDEIVRLHGWVKKQSIRDSMLENHITA